MKTQNKKIVTNRDLVESLKSNDDVTYTEDKSFPRSISKVIEPTGDVCIKFTDEEMEMFDIKAGDKFSIKEDGGGIILEKYQTLEIDLEGFSREVLEMLIKTSCDEDVSVNKVIEDILTDYLSKEKF